jgi:hypothetical protein
MSTMHATAAQCQRECASRRCARGGVAGPAQTLRMLQEIAHGLRDRGGLRLGARGMSHAPTIVVEAPMTTAAGRALLLFLVGCCGSAPTPTERTTHEWPAPPAQAAEPLPRLAGLVLEPRMRRHAAELAALDEAVRASDLRQVAEIARAIVAEPQLAHPAPALAPTLNDELPATFFALQDQLDGAARDVETAALAQDREALETAYTALRSTCDACHALHRDPR